MPKIIGVYKITNPEGKIYIGSSVDVKKRIRNEYESKSPKQKVRCVNESIAKYGYENHIVEIIETCSKEDLKQRERFWQEANDCLYPNGLNKNLVKCKGKKQVCSEHTNQLISSSKIGTPAWNKGVPTSDSTKNTIKERYSPLHRKSSKIILDTSTGVFYYCLREASLAFSIPKQTLRANLSAPNKDCIKNKTSLVYT